jgi:hypothetical protein
MEFTNKPEVIPDLKEKIRVDWHYILNDGHNYKLLTFLKLYIYLYI